MSLLEKIISRKTPAARIETSPQQIATPEKFPAAEVHAEKKPAWKICPCENCGLPVFWISVYEISELEKYLDEQNLSDEQPADPATLDDAGGSSRPDWLRCPECSPPPAASLLGARVVILERHCDGQPNRRCEIVEAGEDWKPIERKNARRADPATLADSAASLVELRIKPGVRPVRIWTKQPSGLFKRCCWLLASFRDEEFSINEAANAAKGGA
jgi:hypothetical protein